MTDTRYRLWMATAFVLALFLVLTIALNYRGTFDQAAQAATASADAHVVDIELSEFALAPADVTVPAGVPVTFDVTNSGVAEHDYTIEGVDGTATIQAGGSATLELPPLEAGTHRILCSIPGHEPAGMVGTLTVSEDADVTPVADVEAAGHEHTEDHTAMTPEQMARMHEQGVADFPLESNGKGNQPMEPEILPDGTKVFELTADEIEWETKPGVIKEAMAYNGQIPGPQLHFDLGDRVRFVVHNELSEPTALHSHGLILPNEMDGVPGLTQASIMPGKSFTYEFTARNSGSHMYHSHFNSADQVTKGLLGAIIVHDPDDPEVDVDYVLIANDGPLGYTLNGKDFPATEPIVAKQGDLVRLRYMNEGLQIHPMHLHGIPQKVIAKDGYPLPEPHFEDTVLVAPGERVDVLVEATELGAWAFHCHILTHAEGPEGMFGMVTALIVEE